MDEHVELAVEMTLRMSSDFPFPHLVSSSVLLPHLLESLAVQMGADS